jgi:hypothetical protein
MQLQNVAGRPQGQEELTRPSPNVPFDKDRDGQVAGFSEKLTRCHPITNVVSR